jgi:hypothetical protein
MNTALKTILVALALLILAGGGYLAYRYFRSGPAAPLVSEADFRALTEPATLEPPDLDLSLSGLKDIVTPEFTAVPELDLGLGTSTDLAIATSLSASLDLTVATSTIAVDLTADDIDISKVGKSTVPPVPSEAEGSGAEVPVPSAAEGDCAQFAAVPSCSYVTGPARTFCEQCK